METTDKIIWETLEYEHLERSNDWYWAVGVITLCISIVSILYKDYLFAIFIVLATLTLVMFSFKKPEEFHIEINNKGIKIKHDFYPYKSLKAFWIDITDEAHKKLIISSDKVLMPAIILPIADSLILDVRTKLTENIKEEEMHEPVSHKIMEYLGF